MLEICAHLGKSPRLDNDKPWQYRHLRMASTPRLLVRVGDLVQWKFMTSFELGQEIARIGHLAEPQPSKDDHRSTEHLRGQEASRGLQMMDPQCSFVRITSQSLHGRQSTNPSPSDRASRLVRADDCSFRGPATPRSAAASSRRKNTHLISHPTPIFPITKAKLRQVNNLFPQSSKHPSSPNPTRRPFRCPNASFFPHSFCYFILNGWIQFGACCLSSKEQALIQGLAFMSGERPSLAARCKSAHQHLETGDYNGPRAETRSIGGQATNHRQFRRPAEELLAPNSTVGSCRVAVGLKASSATNESSRTVNQLHFGRPFKAQSQSLWRSAIAFREYLFKLRLCAPSLFLKQKARLVPRIMTVLSHLKRVHQHNVATLRGSPAAEVSGALGDLGTLLPLMIALAVQHSIYLDSTLVFSGIFNVVTGAVFGIPLPVQPMKAIAAAAISRSEYGGIKTVMAAGQWVSLAVLVMSLTGLLRWVTRNVPVPVVKGIQLGAGLSLVMAAGSGLLRDLHWTHPVLDNRLWALAAFLVLIFTQSLPRFPYALHIFILSLVFAFISIMTSHDHPHTYLPEPSLWTPHFVHWEFNWFKYKPLSMAIGQLPLTTLNSVIAVSALAADLLPDMPTPSVTAMGISVGVMNLVGTWWGAMPVCHGAGGLAAQYRFGARSGASVVILGLFKIVLGLVFGNSLIGLLTHYPKSLLGVMVIAAGLELAKVGHSLNHGASDLWESSAGNEGGGVGGLVRQHRSLSDEERAERWTVMLMTTAGLLAFRNDAIGFIAGMLCFWAYRVSERTQKWWDAACGFMYNCNVGVFSRSTCLRLTKSSEFRVKPLILAECLQGSRKSSRGFSELLLHRRMVCYWGLTETSGHRGRKKWAIYAGWCCLCLCKSARNRMRLFLGPWPKRCIVNSLAVHRKI
ncbi:sulfate transporter [Colletotrichum lupini]|uniref:Sulfate transporter n=1 Tax=Colletotrichum lupini TaxID=145971 RepID=A0A9Q8SX15_9PEZI|nr:sulfate transporter [Colletotrichum lupini]UQC84685.1 sulfate transporter [Colletotrichum lupini]